MHITETALLSSGQKAALLELWNKEYPQKLSFGSLDDFNRYLDSLPEITHYIATNKEGATEGWAFAFKRNEERWFALLVTSSVKGQGKGTILLNKLKEKKQRLNGWVVDHNNDKKQNGETYLSPLRFYQKAGFTVCAETRLETQQLSAVKIVWEEA